MCENFICWQFTIYNTDVTKLQIQKQSDKQMEEKKKKKKENEIQSAYVHTSTTI